MARLRTHGGADGAISGLIYLAVRSDGQPRAAIECERCGAALPASDKCAGCGLDHRYSAKTQDAIEAAQNEYAALAGQTLWSDGIRPRDDESEYSWEERCGPPGPEPVARVLVCQGVDCGGLGGRAALLDIEELCAELDPTIRVAGSVCSLQCANAPVVNVLSAGERRHYIRVDGTRRCGAVVDELRASLDGGPPLAAGATTTSGLMMRRAEGARWQALIQIGRQRGRDAAANKRLIDAALQAELQVCRGDAEMQQRARRRADRLLRAAQAMGARS